MPTYTAPVRDMEFVLNDVLKVQSAGIQGYEELEAEFISAILNEAGKITSEVLAPLNAVGDKEGCHFENGPIWSERDSKDNPMNPKMSLWIAGFKQFVAM